MPRSDRVTQPRAARPRPRQTAGEPRNDVRAPAPDLDPRLHALRALRASVWFEERCPVRALSGFDRRFHRVPSCKTPAADRFVAAVGRRDVDERLSRVGSALREHFRLRRRALRRVDHCLVTADFEYALTVELDPENPHTALFRGEVTHIRELECVASDAFAAVFRAGLAGLSVDFGQAQAAIDLEGLIDAAEERGIPVRYPESCEHATLTLPARGQPVELCFTRRAAEVRCPCATTAKQLVAAFTLAADQLAAAGLRIAG